VRLVSIAFCEAPRSAHRLARLFERGEYLGPLAPKREPRRRLPSTRQRHSLVEFNGVVSADSTSRLEFEDGARSFRAITISCSAPDTP